MPHASGPVTLANGPRAGALAGAVIAVAGLSPALVRAGDPPDKSAYTLFNPTPRELMRDMSTDRPDTTESAASVDAGHFQLEMSLVDYAQDRADDGSGTTRTLAAAPLIVKLGLLNNVDVQLGIDPYTRERTTGGEDEGRGGRTRDGFGDTVVRLKVNLWGNDDGPTALALMPFVKFATADDDLGNDDTEGGIIAPFSLDITEDVSLGLMAELDWKRSVADDRYVVDFLHTATIGFPIVGDLGGYAEYAGFANLNGDEDYRGYADCGLTYAVTPDVLLDAGVRIGLTDAAEDVGFFAGLSWRY